MFCACFELLSVIIGISSQVDFAIPENVMGGIQKPSLFSREKNTSKWGGVGGGKAGGRRSGVSINRYNSRTLLLKNSLV